MAEFTTNLEASSVWHNYGVYRVHSSASKIVICETNPQNTPIFFANPFLYKGKTNNPDVALHAVQPNGLNDSVNIDGRKISAADGKASPIIATSHFRKTGRKIGLAFGDPARTSGQHWEKMTQENFSGSRYSFTLPPPDAVIGLMQFTSGFATAYSIDSPGSTGFFSALPVALPPRGSLSSKVQNTINIAHVSRDTDDVPHRASSSSSAATVSPQPTSRSSSPPPYAPITNTNTAGEGRALTWKRTHSPVLLPTLSPLSRRIGLRNLKLVDDSTGEVLAVFESTAMKSLRSIGTLQVRRDLVAGLADVELGMAGGRRDKDRGNRQKGWHTDAAEAGATLLGIVLSLCVIEERMRREG